MNPFNTALKTVLDVSDDDPHQQQQHQPSSASSSTATGSSTSALLSRLTAAVNRVSGTALVSRGHASFFLLNGHVGVQCTARTSTSWRLRLPSCQPVGLYFSVRQSQIRTLLREPNLCTVPNLKLLASIIAEISRGFQILLLDSGYIFLFTLVGSGRIASLLPGRVGSDYGSICMTRFQLCVIVMSCSFVRQCRPVFSRLFLASSALESSCGGVCNAASGKIRLTSTIRLRCGYESRTMLDPRGLTRVYSLRHDTTNQEQAPPLGVGHLS